MSRYLERSEGVRMSSTALKYFHLITSAAPPPWMQDNRAPQYLQLSKSFLTFLTEEKSDYDQYSRFNRLSLTW